MPTPVRLLTTAEFDAREARRMAEGLTFLEAFGPGAMYHCPWYHDPADAEDMADLDLGHHAGFLSSHYLTTWARKRSPLMVLTPNGRMWCVDQVSTNGTGWIVTGDAPIITAMPSIVVPGYHGWLRDGVFSDDIEGRGISGEMQLG
jgi:hypothetical protein